MKTYSEHYEKCLSVHGKHFSVKNKKYPNVYDLSVDLDFLDTCEEYFKIVKEVAQSVKHKIENNIGTVDQSSVITYLNEWRDIPSIEKLTNYVMPQIEEKIYGCPLQIEFLLPYRNIKKAPIEGSWLWHYDDCPKESIKFAIYLNEVNEKNGCFEYVANDKTGLKLESFRTSPFFGVRKQVFHRSRVPQDFIDSALKNGYQKQSLTGPQGTYMAFSPNVVHRGTVPDETSEPREAIFFILRPALNKREEYINDNVKPASPPQDVKRYNLD